MQRREGIVMDFIGNTFGDDYEITYDRVQNDACGNRSRPDINIKLDHIRLIIEIDERQHLNESYACFIGEISKTLEFFDTEHESNSAKRATKKLRRDIKEAKRMSEIFSTSDIIPTVFIRFNPDKYVDENGKKDNFTTASRHQLLKEEIENWIEPESIENLEHFITVIHLFYDGEKRQVSFVPVDGDEYKLYVEKLENQLNVL
jgi:hypothetical protein